MGILDNIEKNIFSKKYNHAYLYDEITNESVLNIKLIVDDYNKSYNKNGVKMKPKPIILHINSPGGSINAGIALMSIINKSRVPIIVLIEGISASAATFVTVTAKYRVIMPYESMLIHQYSGVRYGKREEILFNHEIAEENMKFVKNLYEKYTLLPKNKLDEILQHDIWLKPEECLKYSLVDKILKVYNKSDYKKYYNNNPNYDLNKNIINIKTNLNNIYIYHDNYKYNKINKMELSPYQQSIGLILTIQYMIRLSNIKPILLHISDTGYFNDTHEILPIINTILLSNIPIYSIIDGPSTNITILYSIVCERRYIYKYSYITLDFVKYWTKNNVKYEDVLENTEFYRNIIKNIFKKYTKLPNRILNNIFKKRFYLNAKDCVKYKLCDNIID